MSERDPKWSAEIIVGLLSEGSTVRVRVTGGSMTPTLNSGDTVLIEPCRESDIELGQIVFIRAESGRGILHRYIGRSAGGMLKTVGDALGMSDPPQRPDALVGRAISVEGGNGDLKPVASSMGARLLAVAGAWIRLSRFSIKRALGGLIDS